MVFRPSVRQISIPLSTMRLAGPSGDLALGDDPVRDLPFHPGVHALGVLPDDDHVQVHQADGRMEPLHRPDVGIQVELLPR